MNGKTKSTNEHYANPEYQLPNYVQPYAKSTDHSFYSQTSLPRSSTTAFIPPLSFFPPPPAPPSRSRSLSFLCRANKASLSDSACAFAAFSRSRLAAFWRCFLDNWSAVLLVVVEGAVERWEDEEGVDEESGVLAGPI